MKTLKWFDANNNLLGSIDTETGPIEINTDDHPNIDYFEIWFNDTYIARIDNIQ